MLSVLGKLSWFFRLEWKRYAIAIPLLVLAGLIEVIPPKIVGDTIDRIQQGTLTWPLVTETLLLLGGLALVIYLITYVWMYQLFGGAFVVERLLRSKLMRHFLKMTPTFYEKNRTGDLMARATNDLKDVSMTAGFGILTLIDSTVWMMTLLAVMSVMISWKLTLAAIIPLPILAICMQLYGKWIHLRFKAAQDAFGDMNDGVLETISGTRVIRAFVQERAAERKFGGVTADVLSKNIAVTKIDSLFEPTIKIIVGLSYLIGLGYGAYLVFRSELTVGALVTFNVYLGMLIWPMFAIGELINIMQRGNASLDRVNETLSYPADVDESPNAVRVDEPAAIEFRNVTFRYPSSEGDNLRDLNIKLERGQTLGIVGRTGSGKTTLIKQLLREYPNGDGSICVSGEPIENIAFDDLKRWIGYVPQNPFLFSRTVRENILFAKGDQAEDRLNEAIELSAFKKDLEFLPQGLETLVGEKGVALSGGQKQRVSIARALLANPEILILDDALSAVDAKTESEIISNIRRSRAGKTTLIVTHRLSAVQHADHIVVLDDGRIVEEGTHEQLLAAGGWYREQWERQQAEATLEGA
ncbi:ABC transporter ATP-binding protein [Paenibacillus alkalitolerans]|uniref:ABC transporter ATP-binding protein n=1 Tax=Paenibacillus alkalitolerans TaxID=2799335 RepID=UPI0018F29944|nr:ABC transporter transmembrane domain-containing protein [Paenibacillus alkalitolerans]